MRGIYGSLVEFIVERMNQKMRDVCPIPGFLSRPDSKHFLGVLDMFGVDNQPGKYNSLEQLLMNYTVRPSAWCVCVLVGLPSSGI